jgi:hypothetical protein
VFGSDFAPARSLSVAGLLEKDKLAMDTIQSGIGPGSVPSRRQDDCYAAWMLRPHQRIRARMEWNVTVTIVAKAGTARVVEADVPDEDWPAPFDTPLERCVLDSYREVSFPAEHDFEVTLDFPLCIYGPDGQGG